MLNTRARRNSAFARLAASLSGIIKIYTLGLSEAKNQNALSG